MIHNDESHNYAAFYYYGIPHLLVSFELILQNAIKKNQLIYLSMEEEFYGTLTERLRLKERLGDKIQFCSTKEIIDKEGVYAELAEAIKKIKKNADASGFSGVMWILKSEDAINQMTKEAFIEWTNSFARTLKDNGIKLICIYDLYDYINEEEYLDTKYIIDEVLNSNKFILNEEEEHYELE